jgi:hypothetical protein
MYGTYNIFSLVPCEVFGVSLKFQCIMFGVVFWDILQCKIIVFSVLFYHVGLFCNCGVLP